MKPVSIYKPVTVEQAIQILSLHGTEAGVYAGGTDLLIRLKNRLKQAPTYLVDIKKIENLRYIREDGQGGVQIGALTKLAEVADSPLSCYRNGGFICYGAIGDNSYYHSAMGGRLCYAVYPGDIATALIPYDAKVTLATPFGPKALTVEQLVPGDVMVDGRLQSHVVRFNEILTEVTIPAPRPGFKASFEKIRPREVWDFAMASLAIGLQMQGNTIQDARVVFGGIAGKPYREHAVENFLKGKTVSPQLTAQAQAMALANSAPLKYNAEKIDMAKGLLASGLEKLAMA